LGHDDSEADDQDPLLNGIDDVVNRTYGWDNESPARVVEVGAFKAEWRPITNDEYMAFWKSSTDKELPKSWVEEDGEIKVCSSLFWPPIVNELIYNKNRSARCTATYQ
jgi:formylglycine-generating enzyme required for sulfatase activity